MSDIENNIAEVENENIGTADTTDTTTLKNDKRKSDLMRQVGKLGEEASLGRDSLPKLAHAVVKAAADGVVTGDDAENLYTRYATAESKKAIHEHSAGGKKANVSKLKQLINMGEMTTIDGVEVMQAAFEARENVIAAEGKVKPAYPFYVEVARAQLKSDTALDGDTLEEMAARNDPNAKTVEGELKRAMKILEGLVTGENRDKIQDASDNTIGAFELIRDRLEQLQMHSKREELRKQAKALGLELA